MQHIYYGVNGDPYTAAFNPIRDTIFFGNQHLYDLWGLSSVVLSGEILPLLALYGIPKSMSNNGGGANTLTDAQKSRLKVLDNTINDHLTEGDFSGTLRDLQGNPVPNGKGGYFDHLGEMKDSYRSLQKTHKGLEGSLKNPNLSNTDRALLQRGLDEATSYISRIEKMFEPYGGLK